MGYTIEAVRARFLRKGVIQILAGMTHDSPIFTVDTFVTKYCFSSSLFVWLHLGLRAEEQHDSNNVYLLKETHHYNLAETVSYL